MTSESCGSYVSCGISTSFPVLSPTIRQVAHALLTRPPLIRPRRDFTVRLECVMHAASVHPEPGSNSLKIVYQAVLPALIQSLRVILLLNYLKELFLKFKRIFGVFFVHFVVVQFSMSDSLSVELPLRDSLFILPHLLPFVKGFLKLFSKFFRSPWFAFPFARAYTRSPGQLRYSITFSSACQPLFAIFRRFLHNDKRTGRAGPFSWVN